MRTTIDAAGRLVIPRELRRRAGLEPGMPLELRWRDGRIEIEPAATPIRLVRRGHLLVAVPEQAAPVLQSETVETTREALQAQRASQD